MATITTDGYLDDAARTAGETFTISGVTFGIRTDTRWHAGAPASMTGALGALTISSGDGGAITIDGTKVRWMPYGSGTGNVPAIGATVTQGGASGYFLGVWADYTSAPTAVGAAMPAAGFIKFREVTGAFSAGALTGIGASATGPDVTGWIEVVMQSSANIITQELGSGLTVSGEWFYLGTTNGSRGQTFSTPTNGGGTGSHINAVQIETTPGSDVYEWWPTAAVSVAGATWSTTNYTTDMRAKIIESVGNGVLRIGSDGTNNIGHLPVTGCKVRIPNIIGRVVTTAARQTNVVPGLGVTRTQITGGNWSMTRFHTEFITSAGSARNDAIECAFDAAWIFSSIKNSPLIQNCCAGGLTMPNGFNVTVSSANAVITGTKMIGKAASGGLLRVNNVSNLTVSDSEFILSAVRTTTSYALYLNGLNNSTFTNLKFKGHGLWMNSGNNVTFRNIDYIDRLEGTNILLTNVVNIFAVNSSNGFLIDGITFGENGQLANTQPAGYVYVSGTPINSNIKIRNMGTRLAPISAGSNATYYPSGIVSMAAGESNISLQRLFITGVRNYPYQSMPGGSANILVEDVYAGAATITSSVPAGRNGVYRKIGAPVLPTSSTNDLGLHWIDYFTSDTTGAIRWMGTTPSVESAAKNFMNVTPDLGTGYLTSLGGISMDTLGDETISESEWKFYGHTGFQNAAPTFAGPSTNYVAYYQLDTGAGFSGTWKQATGANLSAETVSPTGFKLKLRVYAAAGSSTNATTAVTFLTTSTLTAQSANQYPLDTVTLSFEGLKPGSEVRAYVGTDPATAVEIGGTESSGETFSFTHSSSGQDGYIAIFALGYQPIMFSRTYGYEDSTLLIQQVIDRNYAPDPVTI